MDFYTYMYLREDGSPYYAGKGSDYRACQRSVNHYPPRNADGTIDHDRIVKNFWVDEATALAFEMYLIDFWGRKDNGTGILRNLTDGGKKQAGTVYRGRKPVSLEARLKYAADAKRTRNGRFSKGISAGRKNSGARPGTPFPTSVDFPFGWNLVEVN